jgi:hypothetical protein
MSWIPSLSEGLRNAGIDVGVTVVLALGYLLRIPLNDFELWNIRFGDDGSD